MSFNRKVAKILSSEGPGKKAVIEVEGQQLIVRDGFSWVDGKNRIGDSVELEISVNLEDVNQNWEVVFSGNPAQLKSVLQTEGLTSRLLGQIVTIEPVIVDCGVIKANAPIHSSDARIKGQYVGFDVDAIDAEG